MQIVQSTLKYLNTHLCYAQTCMLARQRSSEPIHIISSCCVKDTIEDLPMNPCDIRIVAIILSV